MKTRNLNVLRMAEAVIMILKTFADKINLVPKLAQLYEELQLLADGHHKLNQQLVLGSGTAALKKEKRRNLENGAEELTNSLKLYASMENATDVGSKVDLYYADLHEAAGDTFLDTCNQLHSIAATLGTGLNSYLADAATIEKFKNLIDGYALVLSAPRGDISVRASMRAGMENKIALIRSLLNDKMDMAMNIVKNKEPEFWEAYTNARVIVDLRGKRKAGASHTETLGMLGGTLTDAANDEPITDAIVQLEGVEEATTTDEDGSFAFDQVQPGKHKLLCIKETYKNFSLTDIEVKTGEETEVEGKMEKE